MFKGKLAVIKTTAIGGIIFLLPLIVIGWLLGQLGQIVFSIAEVLNEWIPVKTVTGISLLILIAICIVLILCFAAGLIARYSIGQWITSNVEKYLSLFFPRYVIIREQLRGNIGGEFAKAELKLIQVTFSDHTRLAFEIESDAELVTVFVPGSPDPWMGQLIHVSKDRVKHLPIEFAESLPLFEQLGRNSLAVVSTLAVKSASN